MWGMEQKKKGHLIDNRDEPTRFGPTIPLINGLFLTDVKRYELEIFALWRLRFMAYP